MTTERDDDVLYDPLVAAYWQHVQDEELYVPVCEQCEETFFPPRVACPHCLSERITLRESEGVGTLYSYSVVRTETHPTMGGQTPYVNALIELEEGSVLFANVVGSDPETLSVGTRVSVEFACLDGDSLYPVFETEDEEK